MRFQQRFRLLLSQKLFKIAHYISKSKTIDKNTQEINYLSLSPCANSDQNGHYSEALFWALRNRKENKIKNIALTGPYGSGKSSILETFQDVCKGSEFKFLPISLARFKDEISNEYSSSENGEEKKRLNLIQLIEVSILEQIFYHEDDKKVPDSRFKKIKIYKAKKTLLLSVSYFLLVTSLIYCFLPSIIIFIFPNFKSDTQYANWIKYISISLITFAIFGIIFRSIRVLSSITINKLKFRDAEIGIGDMLNKSVLNHHIDELLYFFSVRPYNVVIIEDLDRFEETEIFTKLRELNLLLNSSEKTKEKGIVFIYAVRDDLLRGDDRTKFFDFIIPVIPIINSSNSSQIIIQKNQINDYNLSLSFIEDISLFFQDMRLVYNVLNEFTLYRKSLSSSLNSEKLFAMIAFKNLCPKDFVLLSKNKGNMHYILQSQRKFINQNVETIEFEISEIKKNIKNIESIKIKDVQELRKLYILPILEVLSDFYSFATDEKLISFLELTLDDNFSLLITDNLKYTYIANNSNYKKFVKNTIKFERIQELTDPNITYEEREKQINYFNAKEIENLKLKISELSKNQKLALRSFKLADILRGNPSLNLDLPDETEQKEFVKYVVKNGYIAEDYFDFISFFYSGSIVESDHNFLMNVKNGIKPSFHYPLIMLPSLTNRLNFENIPTKLLFNYDLLDFILQNQKQYSRQTEILLNELKDESDDSVQFIDLFISYSKNVGLFINYLTKKWLNIWNFYSNSFSHNDEQKEEIFNYILSYAEETTITQIAELSSFADFFASHSHVLNSFTLHPKKSMDVISRLGIKFNDLDFSSNPKELLGFIYSNSHYSFSESNISGFLHTFGKFNASTFANSNYSCILKSELTELIDYVNSNINSYVNDLYLNLITNKNEEEDSLIKLLNNLELSNLNFKSITTQVVTKITKIDRIGSRQNRIQLLSFNKLNSSWENLCFLFSEKDEESENVFVLIIQFINSLDNSNKLSLEKITVENDEFHNYSEFWNTLLAANEIDLIAYNLILSSNRIRQSTIDISKITQEKAELLIKKEVLVANKSNLNAIRDLHYPLSILFIETNSNSLLEIVSELEIDSHELEQILKSKLMDDRTKYKFFSSVPFSTVDANENIYPILASLAIKHPEFVFEKPILENLYFNARISVDIRISLVHNYVTILEIEFINRFVRSLGY